jgi:iron complex transport system ATP-binding protein
MVTHHVEEIPQGFTHTLLLSHGKIVAAGPFAEALTSETLTETFGIPIDLSEVEGRFSARAA